MSLMSRRRLLVAAGSVVLASCTRGESAGAPSGPSDAPNSPLAANRALGIWPDIVTRSPLRVRQAYDYATSSQQTLQFMPCYCGCQGLGHEDNLSCFVSTFSRGGWVVLEPHATACDTCVGIALDAQALERQGVAVTEIRRAIDEKWSKMGPGTPTRLP